MVYMLYVLRVTKAWVREGFGWRRFPGIRVGVTFKEEDGRVQD